MIGCAKAWNSPRICADACTDITLIVYTRADIILIHTLSDIVLIEHIFLLSAQPPHSANAKRARAGDRGGKGAEGRRRGEGCRSRHGRRFGSLLAPIPSPNQRRTANSLSSEMGRELTAARGTPRRASTGTLVLPIRLRFGGRSSPLASAGPAEPGPAPMPWASRARPALGAFEPTRPAGAPRPFSAPRHPQAPGRICCF